MAISTTSTFALFDDNGIDAAARLFKISTIDVKFELDAADNLTATVTLYDANSAKVANNAFTLSSAELVAEEATYTTALGTVRDAVEKAIITRLEAIQANSGATFTFS